MKFKDEIDTIRGYLIALKTDYKLEWVDSAGKESNNDFNVMKGKTKIGSVSLNDTEMSVTGKELQEVIKALIAKKEEAEKMKVTEKRARDSPFKNLFERPSEYNGLKENPFVFNKLTDELQKIGIHEIVMRGNLSRSASISKKITLYIQPQIGDNIRKHDEDNYYPRLKNLLFNKYKGDSKSLDTFSAVRSEGFVERFEKEDVKDIMDDDIKIGEYFAERNLIHLFFNPFQVSKISPIQETESEVLTRILALLKEIKPKAVKVDEVEKKLFITSFLNHAKERLRNIEAGLRNEIRNIDEYERRLRTVIQNLESQRREKEYIEKNIAQGGNLMFEEIEKVKKMPFIDNFELGSDFMKMTFKPANILIPNFKRSDFDKGYGARTVYVGKITFKIGPGMFNVSGDTTIKGDKPHPHGSGQDGGPCFGDGEGRNKIYELLSSNKFSELSTMLWFWIKTYRHEGAYVKMWDLYDDRLKQGYPVWDDKGKLIVVDDPERIKTGEQIKLTKTDNYEDNFKKFSSIKI